MNLELTKWRPFSVGSLFIMRNGKGITQEEIFENPGDFIVVQSGEDNNGVLGKIDLNYCKKKEYIFSENPCLAVARTGSAGFVSFQKKGCVVGDSAKLLILNKEEVSDELYIFLQSILSFHRFKYSYGRKVTEAKYLRDTVLLPIVFDCHNTPLIDETYKYSQDGFVPDWKYMEKYIRTLHFKPLTTKNRLFLKDRIKVASWKEFKFGDLISEIYKSQAINKEDLSVSTNDNNSIRYISRTGENNGCEIYADVSDIENSYIEKENAITIGDTTATCFYQNKRFITGDHMVIIRADSWLNPFTALFVLTILNKEQYRYSYGRAFVMDRIKNTVLKLPSNKEGEPDWNFMEDYIKSLPYGDRL